MKPKIENRSSEATDKNEWKKASSPDKYNNQLKDGDSREKRKHAVEIGNKFCWKKESEEGPRGGFLGCDTTVTKFLSPR